MFKHSQHSYMTISIHMLMLRFTAFWTFTLMHDPLRYYISIAGDINHPEHSTLHESIQSHSPKFSLGALGAVTSPPPLPRKAFCSSSPCCSGRLARGHQALSRLAVEGGGSYHERGCCSPCGAGPRAQLPQLCSFPGKRKAKEAGLQAPHHMESSCSYCHHSFSAPPP